jgi:hypothetical protein
MPFAVTAQEEGASGDNTGSVEAQSVAAPAKSGAMHFHSLVKLLRCGDNVSVKIPRQDGFAPAVEGKFYPHGTAFSVNATEAEPVIFEFGPEATVTVTGAAEFSTKEAPVGEKSRVVLMKSGAVSVSLPRTMPTGLFSVLYPNFSAKDLAGESRHELTPSGDGDEALVHVITGMLALEGNHFKVPRMSAADRIRIRTTGEALFTSLRGEAGDYKVALDKGVSVYRDPITGETKEQAKALDYSLTPQCAIKIFRKRSSVGGRIAVSVMTFDAVGEMRNRYTFVEGAPKVNFGEEVVRVQDISFKVKAEKAKTGDKKPAQEAAAPAESASSEQSSGESSADSSGDSGFGSF